MGKTFKGNVGRFQRSSTGFSLELIEKVNFKGQNFENSGFGLYSHNFTTKCIPRILQ